MSTRTGRLTAAQLKARAARERERTLRLQFVAFCRAKEIPVPDVEHVFAKPRQWRFDFAWPLQQVALESEGGIWTKGRHTRGSGFIADLEKYNTAALRGWRVFRTVPGQLCTDDTIAMLRQALRIEPRAEITLTPLAP